MFLAFYWPVFSFRFLQWLSITSELAFVGQGLDIAGLFLALYGIGWRCRDLALTSGRAGASRGLEPSHEIEFLPQGHGRIRDPFRILIVGVVLLVAGATTQSVGSWLLVVSPTQSIPRLNFLSGFVGNVVNGMGFQPALYGIALFLHRSPSPGATPPS